VRGALVERLDVLQNVLEAEAVRGNQIPGQRVKHEGVIRVGRVAERQRRLFHPRKLNHAARSVTTRSFGSWGLVPSITRTRLDQSYPQLTANPRRFNCGQNRSGACVVLLLQTTNLSVFPAAARAERQSPTTFRLLPGSPPKPAQTYSFNKHTARIQARRVPNRGIRKFDGNPNYSERLRANWLSLFFQRDKNCAADEKFALPFGEIRD